MEGNISKEGIANEQLLDLLQKLIQCFNLEMKQALSLNPS
jgi:hypothetical protein